MELSFNKGVICMFYTMNNFIIRGMVSSIPTHKIDNSEYQFVFGEKEVKKQIRVTGIHTRQIVTNGQRGADLCIAAAKNLMKQLLWKSEEVSAVVFVSSYPSYPVYPTSYAIRDVLGLPSTTFAMDVNLACSGFLTGLQVVNGFLESKKEGTKVLLLVADVTSESVDEGEQSNCMLFGDGGAAIGIEKKDNQQIPYVQCSDGNGYRNIFRASEETSFEMNGMEVFNFSISRVTETLKEFIKDCQLSVEQVDYFVSHQAQKFIVDKVCDFSGIPKEKSLISYDKYGNTGCASIPITICEHKQKFTGYQTNVLLAAFGGGYSWSCVYIQLDKDIILDLIESDVIYDKAGRKNGK